MTMLDSLPPDVNPSVISIQVYESGREFFPRLFHLIANAQHSVAIETYIWADDPIGWELATTLIAACKRGVRVQIIIDWLGTGHAQCKKWIQYLTPHGIEIQRFNPFFRRGIARTHRKIAVIDHFYGFIGGINLKDDHNGGLGWPRLSAPRWDFCAEIQGAKAQQLQRVFDAQWDQNPLARGRSQWQYIKGKIKREQRTRTHKRTPHYEIVLRDNFKHRNAIHKAYLDAITHARRRITLVTPYFAPSRRLRQALIDAAQHGIEVILLIGVGEIALQDKVARSFYPLLMRHGVRLYEYRLGTLHAKVAVVDTLWATLGSSNCDALSLFINQEANIMARDPDFAHALEQKVLLEVERSVAIDPASYAQFSVWQRLGYRLAYIGYRLTMRLLSKGQYN